MAQEQQMSAVMSPRQRLARDADVLRRWGVAPFAAWPAAVRRSSGRKLCVCLEDAIKRSGLSDGGTISVHPAFGESDLVLLQVVAELDRLGYRDLTLAAGPLTACHAGLIEYITRGVISRIYTSGVSGELGAAISRGLLKVPVTLHSDGGRCALLDTGELRIDVAFIGVPACDQLGNANGTVGVARCGSLGYAVMDARRARCVVAVTQELAAYPLAPASIREDQVDLVVQIERVAEPAPAGVACCAAADPGVLLMARCAADVLVTSGLFLDGFSLRTGCDSVSVATVRYLRDAMMTSGITAGWALGGITGGVCDMQRAGLVGELLDVRTCDARAVDDLATNPHHHELGVSECVNPFAKGAAVDQLDLAVLPALQVGLDFGINELTGADGVLRGAVCGHPDVAAGAKLAIVVAPLVRDGAPTIVEEVNTLVTPGPCIGALVTDAGVAVNPLCSDLAERLSAAGLPVCPIEQLYERGIAAAADGTGTNAASELTDAVVGIVRYRDGSVIDTVHGVAG